jgi:hypothetical protein
VHRSGLALLRCKNCDEVTAAGRGGLTVLLLFRCSAVSFVKSPSHQSCPCPNVILLRIHFVCYLGVGLPFRCYPSGFPTTIISSSIISARSTVEAHRILRRRGTHISYGLTDGDKVRTNCSCPDSHFYQRLIGWEVRPPLWSSGQSSWLHIQRSVFDSRRYQFF